MHCSWKVPALTALLLSLGVLPALSQGFDKPGFDKPGFDKQEIDNRRFVAVASPYGDRAHQLRIIHQIGNSQSCWSEIGTAPVQIDLLLNQFDYTNICQVSVDSNGFSLRMGDQDLGLVYSLRILNRDNDLVLVAMPPIGVKAPELEIGRAGGYVEGAAKIQLNPGWRLTQRSFNGKLLGHFYLTYDQPLETFIAAPATPAVPDTPDANAPTGLPPSSPAANGSATGSPAATSVPNPPSGASVLAPPVTAPSTTAPTVTVPTTQPIPLSGAPIPIAVPAPGTPPAPLITVPPSSADPASTAPNPVTPTGGAPTVQIDPPPPPPPQF